MNYNRQSHDRKSIRLKDYDYSFPGWYYVTICTKNFASMFGKVKNGKVVHNQLGKIATKYFEEIPEHFDNAEIDECIIMPNHAHGIIIINDAVGTRDRVSLRSFGSVSKGSLSIIINQYKGSVIRIARKNGYNEFSWQSRFYEHIIRNDNDLHRKRTYIRNNPLKWELDEYYNL
jgi:putative transposase